MKSIKWLLVVIFLSTSWFVFAQSYEFSLTKYVYFEDNTPNQVSYLVFPDTPIWGHLKVTVTGGNWFQLNIGELSKTFAIGREQGSTTGFQRTQITEAFGNVASNFSIGEFDFQNRRIPIYHLSSQGNELIIKVEGLLNFQPTVTTILSNLSVSTLTTATFDQQRQYKSIMQDRLGINTINPLYTLDVNGTIHAQEIRVDLNGADFVFNESYKLMPLEKLEMYIKENKHLPDIAPACDMQVNGASIGELNSSLIQKVEELTLYIINQNKELTNLKTKINELQKMNINNSK